MRTHYDALVLGVGEWGPPRSLTPARRGLSVVGIEQDDVPSERAELRRRDGA